MAPNLLSYNINMCVQRKRGRLNFRNCQWTDYVNSWDSNVDYYVPAGSYVIRGVSSYHSNYYE
uniref:Uncharacterized protein n=1 Tax=Magallana gigas TaxID=29159 RepID=K1PVS0_MAGGI